MQWSTFPMHKGRWARLRSLVKLLIGSLFSGDRVWMKTYPITLLHWLVVRWHYRWMKVRERDLRQILAHIDEQC
jgi:hypothetical protein